MLRGLLISIVGLLLGLSAITVPWDTLLMSVGLYIVVPVLAAAAFTHLFHIVARTEIARRAQTGRIRGG